jgi:hypothetical protein
LDRHHSDTAPESRLLGGHFRALVQQKKRQHRFVIDAGDRIERRRAE